MNAVSDVPSADSSIICACQNLTRTDMHSVLATFPGLGFDAWLQRTGAGQTCTACLLDLEYEFVTFDHGAFAGRVSRNQEEVGVLTKVRRPWKRRLYDMLDAISPRSPVPLEEVLPVIAGGGFSQALVIANHSLFYDGSYAAPPMRVEIILRDAEGQVRLHEIRTVSAGETWRHELSSMLEAEPNGSLRVGSVTIIRSAKQPGFRGTTRPQTELIGPEGAAAVHSQSARWNGGGEVVFDGRSEVRRFISFVNAQAQPVRLALRYPLPLDATPDIGQTRAEVILPPFGAAFVEIDAVADAPGGSSFSHPPLCRVSWRGTGRYKAHAFNADACLTRLSIDHL